MFHFSKTNGKSCFLILYKVFELITKIECTNQYARNEIFEVENLIIVYRCDVSLFTVI